MKHLIHLSFLSLALFVSACTSNAQQPVKASTTASSARIDVIDFHNEHRCKTCLTIQSLTEEVLNSTFASEKKAGTITFRTVNVDDEANAKLAEEFGAYGSALFLHVHKNGKAEKIDLTEWAFMSANDAAKFKTELTKKLRAAL